MHWSGLKEEIKKAAYNGKTDQEVADILNAEVTIVSKTPVLINEATLAESLDIVVAETILQKLEAIGQANSVVKRASGWFKPSEKGINIASANARTMVDQLVLADGLTAEEGAALKALAETKMSLAQSLGYTDSGYVLTENDIKSVR